MKGKIGRDSYGLACHVTFPVKRVTGYEPKAAKQKEASPSKTDTHSQALSLFCSFALEGNMNLQLIVSIGS